MEGVRALLAAVLMLPGFALASIGKVTVLEGTAVRMNQGETQALQVGSEIELNDTLQVGPTSNLKVTLTDESVLMLGEGSRLFIDEASFEGQDRKGFIAKLELGKVWARVKKALVGSNSKFEVKTDRAVAGVRGTIFQVEYGDTTKAMLPPQQQKMVVRVVQGRVVVTPPGQPAKKGERKQVPGPQEISQEKWEQKFVELQAKQQVEIGENWGKAGPLEADAMKDSFGRFVDRNQ
jgi:hypothetical protein